MTLQPDRKLPPAWRWVRLGEVCEHDRNVIEPGTLLAASRPYLSLEHIESNTGRILQAPSEPTEDQGQSTTFAFDSRHVLYGKLRPYLNKVALPDFDGRCTTELIPLLPRGTNRRFLAWLLRRNETVDAAMRGKTGSRMPRADMDDLLSIEVPLPPLEEQERIAAILNEQMAAVERARAAAEAQLEAAKSLPAAYLRAVFNSPEARAWPGLRLGNILQLRKEVTHPRDNPKGRARFVGLEHIESGTGLRTGSLEVEMSDLTGRKPRFYKDDVVYGYLRPYLNKVWVAEFDGLCSVDQYVYSVAETRADPTFVAWFLRSPVYLERAPISTTPGQLPRIRIEEIAAVEVNLPPLSEQRRISTILVERMAALERLRKELEQQLAAINALPAILLQQAFSGEL